MTWVDQAVLVAYVSGIIGISLYIARRQRSGEQYFLASRSMGPSKLSMSIIANQVSAVSLIGAPAFVALRAGGGMKWLQYEIAVPLAMIVLIAVIVPMLRSVRGASIYEFAEWRFGRGTRKLLASIFLLSRGLALGVILYASAVVVSATFSVPVDRAIAFVGLLSVVYTTMGGIVADIWTDIIQLLVLWAGTLASVLFLGTYRNGVLWSFIPAERTRTLVLDSAGLAGSGDFGFWPMLLGGLFLYISYYGCDQSQAQRLLTAKSDEAANWTLVLNGLFRFGIFSGMLFARSAHGVIVLINMIGSAFYGPVLAVFILGAVAPRVRGVHVIWGLCGGLAGNLVLAVFAQGVSWLWWNPFGFLVPGAIALMAARSGVEPPVWCLPRLQSSLLWGAFVSMLLLLALSPSLW